MSMTADALREPSGIKPQVVYHYCGPDGLVGILQSGKIWASSVHHLNDISEQVYAAERLRDLVREIAPEISAETSALPGAMLIDRAEEMISYVACFSEHSDQLSQWRAYAPPAGGFAIGIETSSLSGDWLFGRCIYDHTSQRRVIEAILQDHPSLFNLRTSLDQLMQANEPQVGSFIAALLTLVPLLKHPGFSEEAEWRIVRGPIEAEQHQTRFRVSRGAMIPYQCIPLVDSGAELPIAEVVIGPSVDARGRTYGATRMLLDEYGLKGCDLRVSEIPYRGW
jgi:hypothetical protein